MKCLADKNNLAEVFSGIAPYYDFLNSVLSFNSDKSWRRRLVDIARVKENMKVLDLCAGTAEVGIEFFKRQRGCRVFGADFSWEMLKAGKEKIKKIGAAKDIHLVGADVFALPFQAGCFDIVSISFGLRNLIDCRGGIIEMSKMLKKGGRVIILEFSPPSKSIFGKVYKFYLGRILPLLSRVLGGSPGAYNYLSSSIAGFFYPKDILGYMRSAGLENLRQSKMSCGVVNFYWGQKN